MPDRTPHQCHSSAHSFDKAPRECAQRERARQLIIIPRRHGESEVSGAAPQNFCAKYLRPPISAVPGLPGLREPSERTVEPSGRIEAVRPNRAQTRPHSVTTPWSRTLSHQEAVVRTGPTTLLQRPGCRLSGPLRTEMK